MKATEYTGRQKNLFRAALWGVLLVVVTAFPTIVWSQGASVDFTKIDLEHGRYLGLGLGDSLTKLTTVFGGKSANRDIDGKNQVYDSSSCRYWQFDRQLDRVYFKQGLSGIGQFPTNAQYQEYRNKYSVYHGSEVPDAYMVARDGRVIYMRLGFQIPFHETMEGFTNQMVEKFGARKEILNSDTRWNGYWEKDGMRITVHWYGNTRLGGSKIVGTMIIEKPLDVAFCAQQQKEERDKLQNTGW